jgi:hypothetical protein
LSQGIARRVDPEATSLLSTAFDAGFLTFRERIEEYVE